MTQPDFTTADFLAWARTKPAGERYNYQDRYGCALCRFLQDTGRARAPVVSSYSYAGDVGGWREQGASDQTKLPYEREIDEAVSAGILHLAFAETHPEWTFGELVKRLAKLAPETIVPPSEWVKIDTYMNDLVMS